MNTVLVPSENDEEMNIYFSAIGDYHMCMHSLAHG